MSDGEKKWTNGPWHASIYGDHYEVDVCGPPVTGTICEVAGRFFEGGEHQANAHLIAAAPDLYDALEMLCANEDGPGPEDWEFAFAVLRKARGESTIPSSDRTDAERWGDAE